MSDISFLFKKKREQVEYCSIDCRVQDIVEMCNQHGKECWMLCEVIKDNDNVTLIFARTKMSQNESSS